MLVVPTTATPSHYCYSSRVQVACTTCSAVCVALRWCNYQGGPCQLSSVRGEAGVAQQLVNAPSGWAPLTTLIPRLRNKTTTMVNLS